MKIRMGFVSNSSTTSFCLYGIRVPGKLEEEFSLKDTKLQVECFNPILDKDEICIGMGLTEMKEDETKAEFKKRVEALLKKSSSEEVFKAYAKTLGWHEDAYYDG